MTRNRSILVTIVATLFMLMAGARSAPADIVTFDLTVGNPAVSGFTGPFATVSVNRTDSTHATITFESYTTLHGAINGNDYLFGDGGTVDLNVNGLYTLSLLTEHNSFSGFNPTFKDNTPGQVDGFGIFTLSLNNKGGYGDSADKVTFTLTKTSGTWTSASNVLAANAGGSTAAAHIFVTKDPGDPKATAFVTGFAANGQQVPDGGMTLVLLGGTLFGLESLRRKFRA